MSTEFCLLAIFALNFLWHCDIVWLQTQRDTLHWLKSAPMTSTRGHVKHRMGNCGLTVINTRYGPSDLIQLGNPRIGLGTFHI